MTTEWRAILTWPHPGPDKLADAQLTSDGLTAELADAIGALSGFAVIVVDDRQVRAEVTVDGTTLRQATDAALRAGRDLAQAAAVPLGQPTQLRVLPADEHDAEISRPPAQELIGYTEAGEILRVSPQRARQLATERTDFPAPVATPAMGPIYTRASVEAFAKLPRKGGRPRKATD